MKDKKAVKKLSEAEAILADVIDRHTTIEKSAGDLLLSAKSSICRAKESLIVPPPEKTEKIKLAPTSGKKLATKAGKRKHRAAPKAE